ncbi:Helicase associated domain protein [Flavitalea flava]
MGLFRHNKEAFDKAVCMFEQGNRTCIIQPTGTGKSMIIAEFIKQNKSKRHLLLAPGTHIFSEIRKHLEAVEISCGTYIGLMANKSLFRINSYDYIYLDEFHRLGADVWGDAVKRLLALNQGAKILGTSATHIRYLDDNRNMASEIFNDRIATQMSLNSAIINGILPFPTYVSALYSVQSEYEKMHRKISQSTLKNKETALRELKNKVIDWENSSGLDVIIRKHLSTDRRRIIVFCKDWGHLEYGRKVLDPIFERIYGSFKSMSIYSKKRSTENETALGLFRTEDENVIVLYAIDKINEGLHSKSCNTVILMRDTVSPIVFYQQIGRAFSIAPTNPPLIIDLVNNFMNLHFNFFKSDIERESNLLQPGRQPIECEEKKTAIQFIDETQDIRQIFSFFKEEVDAYKKIYKKAKSFFEENGHLYVPYINRELYEWIRLQRESYLRGRMGKNRAAQLRAIGMDLEQELPIRWMTVFTELKDWVKVHGSLPNFAENTRIYTWMVRQRQAFNAGTLLLGQVDILNTLISLEGDKRVEIRIKKLINYFKGGNGSPTDQAIRPDIQLIKISYQKNSLSVAELRDLRNANVPIDGTLVDFLWLENVKKFLAFYKVKNRPPKKEEEPLLYAFCIRERSYLNQIHPHSKFIDISEDFRDIFDDFQKKLLSTVKPDWNERFSQLKREIELNGCVSENNCDKKLVDWVRRQRRFIRDGILSPEKVKKLLTIKEINWYVESGFSYTPLISK